MIKMTWIFNYRNETKDDRNAIRRVNYLILRHHLVSISNSRRCRDFTASKIATVLKTNEETNIIY